MWIKIHIGKEYIPDTTTTNFIVLAVTNHPQIVEFDSAGVFGGIKTGMELDPNSKFSQVIKGAQKWIKFLFNLGFVVEKELLIYAYLYIQNIASSFQSR